MNKKRKVLITITYNEMGIIIDTKAEEVAQSDLQPTCNQLATDCISRKAALDGIADYLEEYDGIDENGNHDLKWCAMKEAELLIKDLPSAQPETNCSEIPNTSDFVSRKAVRAMVSAWAYDLMELEDLEMALQDVDELPPVQDFYNGFADLRAEQEERNIISPVLHPAKET